MGYNDLNREIDSKVARSKGEDNGYDILCYDDGDVSTPQESCSPPEDEPAPDQEEAEPAPKKIRREELPDNTEPNMDVTDDLQKPQPPTLCLSTAKTTQLTEPSQFDETLHAFAHVAVENDQDDFSKLYAAKAAVQKRMTDKQKRGFDKCWMKRSLKMQNTGKSKKHHEKNSYGFCQGGRGQPIGTRAVRKLEGTHVASHCTRKSLTWKTRGLLHSKTRSMARGHAKGSKMLWTTCRK